MRIGGGFGTDFVDKFAPLVVSDEKDVEFLLPTVICEAMEFGVCNCLLKVQS
jgi:hypothetical protein